MKSAPLKLMALIFLTMLVLPLASSEDARSMEKYLDCLTDKKADIVFVFDTSNSMGGEINELSAVVRDFATDLEASRIDYRLGLVEFRDFPITCGERTKISCGSPGDFAYKVKDNGALTAEVNTFSSWLKELKAGGGGTGGPEAVLAALRHAGSDLLWRSDAEKVIIVLTDAGPHPDGNCCNAEGDTLEGTIFGLTSQGARVHVIGSEDAALRRIAGDTGGQFFKIRSGLSLKPLLKEITGAMSCSFKVEAETTCLNRTLEAMVRLVGKEVVPFVAGQTEAWMYLDQAGSKSRYNLSYDQTAGAYLADVPEVCGPVELTVYGRVGERSAVQTVQVECGSCGVAAVTHGTLSISGRVFNDSNGDGVKGTNETGLEGWDVLLERPDRNSETVKTDQKGYYIFTGLLPGIYGLGAVTLENWTATSHAAGVRDVELVDVHESEIDFGFSSKQAKGQPPNMNELFNRTFGGPNWDGADSVQLTLDGGYILVGRTESNPSGINSWLIKTDSQGHEVWNRTFYDATWYSRNSVQPTTDGGYILAGGYGTSKFTYLIKTDSQGHEVWRRTFVRSNTGEGGTSVQLTTDGGYILTDMISTADGRSDDFRLIKTDSQGHEVWNRTYYEDMMPDIDVFGSEPDLHYFVGMDNQIISFQPTTDGGYILTGSNPGQMGFPCWLMKTDSQGHEVWSRRLLDNGIAWSIQPTPDGNYILAGQSYHPFENGSITGKNDIAAWLIKVDTEGNKLWNRTFCEVGSQDIAFSVQPTIDGGYILAGLMYTIHSDHMDALLIKTDADGNEVWSRTFGGFKHCYATSVQPTSDGGYILAGSTDILSAVDGDAWLLKVDADGNIVQLPSRAG